MQKQSIFLHLKVHYLKQIQKKKSAIFKNNYKTFKSSKLITHLRMHNFQQRGNNNSK